MSIAYCVSCSVLPEVKDNLSFNDVRGNWESTGYLHYMKIDLISPESSTLTMIDQNQKAAIFKIININFDKSDLSFDGIANNNPSMELKFNGFLLGNRLFLTEEGSKNDVLSFIRQNELTELRNMSTN